MLGGLLCELPATGSVLRSWRDQHLLVGDINPNHLGQSKKTLMLQADGSTRVRVLMRLCSFEFCLGVGSQTLPLRTTGARKYGVGEDYLASANLKSTRSL